MKSTRNLAVWIILGLLIIGLTGFGATSFSGGASRLGTVGEKEISINDYAGRLRNQLRASAQGGQAMSVQQAQALGIDQMILRGLVTERVLDNEMTQLGLSMGDARIAEAITGNPAFQGPGGFDRETYRDLIERAGFTEASFEASTRDETLRALLQAAVASGAPEQLQAADLMLAYRQESRDLSWALIDAPAAPLEAPDSATLEAFYAANPALFMAPETRAITIAALTPAMMIDAVELDEDALRALYDERASSYQQPERRLIERLVFGDEAQAAAAAERIAAGAPFETLVNEQGLALADVDMGDVSRADLGPIGDAIFAAEEGSVAGPLMSRVGPALFRINAVLAAQITSFDEARPDLREELATQRAIRMIDAEREQIEDLIAGGARLEDLAERTEMELSQIAEWTPESSEGFAAYAAISEAIGTLEEGALPALIELDDGGLAALRLDGITPTALRPFETVEAEVQTAWTQDATVTGARAHAAALLPQLTEGADFAALGLAPSPETSLTRRAFIEGAPREMIARAFEMAPGDTALIEAPTGAALLRIDGAGEAPLDEDTRIASRSALAAQMDQSLASDLLAAFTARIQRDTEIRLDQATLNAVHAQLQ